MKRAFGMIVTIFLLASCAESQEQFFEGKWTYDINRGNTQVYWEIKKVNSKTFMATYSAMSGQSVVDKPITRECFIDDENHRLLVCNFKGGKDIFNYHENEGTLYSVNSFDSSKETKMNKI